MSRIIAGTLKGRRLLVPQAGTRPTSDRAREAVFSSLEARLGGFSGRHVLDLFAGSGALGLEALSRGAGLATFVESDRRAADVLAANIDALGLTAAVVHRMPVRDWVRPAHGRVPDSPADVALIDPPYAMSNDAVTELLEGLAEHGRLAANCVVVVERSHRSDGFQWPTGFDRDQGRRYGEAKMWFGRFGSVTAC